MVIKFGYKNCHKILKVKKLIKNNKLWVNFLISPSDYFEPGTPFKNLNRGRVCNIIGKTVPIFLDALKRNARCAVEVRL